MYDRWNRMGPADYSRLREPEDLHTQPLHLAAAAYQVEAAKLLLQAGANIDRKSADRVSQPAVR